ncbi:hypothetical protein TGRUB_234507 [Toxoplasma gondii RUB]|uniref:Uncharacterized protein n=2 Tax=Toxoplasma gondii TaxID=5811 RepID=S7UWD2_TOXGG|nr:hypothetical protein TGGT1_234507 [Toxoplasma gondii GT1]KFG58060.1 hypothetical protein TGRUB_234507 [Toxoplasma gondii RUB]
MGKRILFATVVSSLASSVHCQVASANIDGVVRGSFIGPEPETVSTATPGIVIEGPKFKLPEVDLDLLRTGVQLQATTILFDRRGAGPVKLSADKNVLFISGSRASLMSVDDATDTVSFGSHTTVNNAVTLNGPITSNGHSDWWLWSLNTFDSFPLEGFWTPQEFSTCGTNADHFLGGPCKFAANRATGTYLNVPRHSEVKIKARVHFFDEWTGQNLYMKLGNTIVWTASHNWCPKGFAQDCASRGVDACGHSYPDTLSKSLEVAVPHSAPFLAITFGSTFDDGANPCTASWGVDDVAIYLR